MEEILCDVCFTELKSNKSFDFCDECQDMVDRHCFLCDTTRAEPVDYVCDSCIEEMDKERVMRSGCVISAPASVTKWEWPEI
jgi:hypothetical protein